MIGHSGDTTMIFGIPTEFPNAIAPPVCANAATLLIDLKRQNRMRLLAVSFQGPDLLEELHSLAFLTNRVRPLMNTLKLFDELFSGFR